MSLTSRNIESLAPSLSPLTCDSVAAILTNARSRRKTSFVDRLACGMLRCTAFFFCGYLLFAISDLP
jgi:hypothetical protein